MGEIEWIPKDFGKSTSHGRGQCVLIQVVMDDGSIITIQNPEFATMQISREYPSLCGKTYCAAPVEFKIEGTLRSDDVVKIIKGRN